MKVTERSMPGLVPLAVSVAKPSSGWLAQVCVAYEH